MKQLIKSMLPEAVFTLRGVARAQREHEKSKPVWQDIRQEFIDGAVLLSDRLAMLDRLPKDAVVAEIGVAEGSFSKEILTRTNPKTLHLIDPWDSPVPKYSASAIETVKKNVQEAVDSGVVKFNRGYSCPVMKEFEDNYFDWVYLDAAHDYENVRLDLQALNRTVKPGGLICGHDYVRWVSQTDRYGVVEAVNEFVNATGSQLVFLTNQYDKHDSFAVRLNK